MAIHQKNVGRTFGQATARKARLKRLPDVKIPKQPRTSLPSRLTSQVSAVKRARLR